MGRYYDPATGQFLTVDPLVVQTGQAYAYVGDDPVNGSDPTGLASAGSICGQYGSGSRQCAAAQQLSKRVVNSELANDATSDPCVHIIDIAGAIANASDAVWTHVKAHPVATIGVVAGTLALAIPGTQEVDTELIAVSGEDLATSVSVSQTVKAGLTITAVGASASDCAHNLSVSEACGATAFGISAGVTGSQADELLAWTLSAGALFP